MNGSRFDEIAHALAADVTRRQILHSIAAVITGITAFSVRAGATTAQSPTACFQDRDCLGDTTNPCSGASCVGGACTFFIATCIPGYVCCGNGGCCPAAALCLSDADCVNDDPDPCTGVSCQDGMCLPYIVSCIDGFVCCDGACAQSCTHPPAVNPLCQSDHAPFPLGFCDELAEAVLG